jgi:polar amino acid transport system substrate-binding protein
LAWLVYTNGPVPEATAAGKISERHLDKSPTLRAIKARGKLRAGAPILLPMMAKDPNTGRFVGVGVELAQVIADDIGVPLEVIEGSFTGAVPGIVSGQWDINVGTVWATPERMQVVSLEPTARA